LKHHHRLYVHSPDRLARKHAYQVLLVEEFQRCGVEVVFLNRELGRSPEDDLLLQVQVMMAEYERAVHVQPVKTDITLPLALPSHRQEREKGLLRRAEQLHERQ
jgi:DNA invertase Pin-like site-specific DNA recombinase